jgi:hypothetical protein
VRRARLVTPLLTAALLALAALAAAPSNASALVVGIADQKADMFLDKRFGALGIRHARINVPWDALTSDWQRAELDRWMFFAQLNKVEPLVGFGHSRIQRRLLPTPERFKHEFKRFRKRYPWVKTFATWNEANHCGQPTCHRERLVAAYWRKLRQACPRCRILAAELLDMPNMLAWVRKFRRYAKVEPKWWGLHNYVEANRFKSTRLRSLLRRVKGEVWLTEVGGLVKRRTKKRYTVKRIPESAAHAKRVTRFLFEKLLPANRRVTRVYLYHWNSLSRTDTWDSALIGPTGKRRPAYAVLARQMRKLRQLRAARARARPGR